MKRLSSLKTLLMLGGIGLLAVGLWDRWQLWPNLWDNHNRTLWHILLQDVVGSIGIILLVRKLKLAERLSFGDAVTQGFLVSYSGFMLVMAAALWRLLEIPELRGPQHAEYLEILQQDLRMGCGIALIAGGTRMLWLATEVGKLAEEFFADLFAAFGVHGSRETKNQEGEL